ncbi:MAG: glycosyltransferase family 4 protein, partial [bacterium]
MRILYLSQYFPPEIGATQTRAYEMATNLVRMGHKVTVLCEIPNHPKGIVFPEFRGKRVVRREENGVEIHHLWVYTSPVKNFKTRMLFYLTFAFSAVIAGVFLTRGRFDVVYATSPPLFVGAAGRIIAAIKRTKFVFEVRDLWPDSAVALGELSEGRAARLARSLEHHCYRSAKKLIVVTQGIYDTLSTRGGGTYRERLRLITNGTNTAFFRRVESQETIKQLELTEKFVAIYAGIFGIAQGMHTIIECAELLKNENVIFLLIGEGPLKIELAHEIHTKKCTNVILHDEVTRENMPHFYSTANASIVPLRRLEIFKGALPSKM